jgi:hypothetical protein
MNLNINFAPKFLTGSPASASFDYGSKAHFNCSTTENPVKNSVKWFFTQKGTTDTRLLSGQSKDYLDVTMYEKDEGSYECAIVNELGEIRRKFTANLVPKGKPLLKL